MVLALMLIGISTLAFSIQPVEAAAQITILANMSGWLDSLGYYHVSGEVINEGDGFAMFVIIVATFYNSSNVVVATENAYSRLDVIPPGRKSPFEILLLDEAQSAKVDHYSLTGDFNYAGPINEGLQILSNNSHIDTYGWLHVVGEIKNIATGPANFVEVIATFYDSTGKVVASDFTYSNPSDLNGSQTASFELILMAEERVPLIASYALTADSQQFSMVPEFPSIIVLPLFMILSLFTIIVSKRTSRH